MDLSQIRELLSVVAESNVEELTVEEEDLKITVRKSAPTIMVQPGGSGGGYPMPAPYPPQGYAAQGGYAPQNAQPAAPQQQQRPAAGQQAPAGQPGGAAPTQQAAPSAGGAANASSAEAAPPDAGEDAAPAESGTTVPAPIVGTFYRSPSPEDDPYVEVGDTVKKGDVLCIIEAMKLMNEIECETPGTVKEILVDDAEPVEYEQPLFVIEEV